MSSPGETHISRQMTSIFLAVAGYWFVSISMVFANKALLGSAGATSAPMFITWYQCIITVAFCCIFGKLRIGPVPAFEIKPGILKEMISLSLVFTAMIVFNNLCLKYVEVSFYQVARSLTIVFNVIFDFLVLGQKTSLPAIGCCGLVISGFLLGNNQEIRWTPLGVLFGVCSSFFVAMYAITVKKKYELVNDDPWKITLYNNFNALYIFLPLILVSGELQTLRESSATTTLNFWILLTCSGFLGVAISFATAAQIKYTSPLTHNVSATAKAAAQTLIALAFYRNPITSLGLLSVGVVLAGSLCYTLVRRSEMTRKFAQEAASQAALDSAASDTDTTKDPLLHSEK